MSDRLAIAKPAKRRKRRKDAKPRCRVQRCNKRIEASGLCKTHLVREADRIFSERIRARDGHCRRCGITQSLQCAHLVSRRYRSVRWSEGNAVALCAKCHTYLTHRPLEHEDFVEELFGMGSWHILRREALAGGDWKAQAQREIARAIVEANV